MLKLQQNLLTFANDKTSKYFCAAESIITQHDKMAAYRTISRTEIPFVLSFITPKVVYIFFKFLQTTEGINVHILNNP